MERHRRQGVIFGLCDIAEPQTEPRPSGSGLARLEPTAGLRARLGKATR